MATRLEKQKFKWQACICSPNTYGLINGKFSPYGKNFIGIKIFKEVYFPDDRIWLLDEGYTDVYIKDGFSGLIIAITTIKDSKVK